MTKLFRYLVPLLFIASLFVTAVASAAAARSFLKSKQNQLTALIKKPSSGQNDKELAKTFDELLDYGAFAKKSLNEEWEKRTDEERAEFQELLTTLVRRSYTKNLRDTLDYEIVFGDEVGAEVGKLVSSIARHKTNARKEVVHIDYLVHKIGEDWLVYDIITEGESLVGNYTSQFRRVIKKSGFSSLMEKMRKKAKEG